MELGRRLLGKGMEKTTIVFDLSDAGYNSLDISSMKHMVTCFQNNYPESLNRCFVLNAPWIFWAFWKLLSQLLDPIVASKITFIRKNEDLLNYIDEENIPIYILPREKYNNISSTISNQLENSSYDYWEDTLSSIRKKFQQITLTVFSILNSDNYQEMDGAKLSNLLIQRSQLQVGYKEHTSKALLKSYSRNIYEDHGILDHNDPAFLDWNKKIF